MDVDAAGISAKLRAHYPGRSVALSGATAQVFRLETAERRVNAVLWLYFTVLV